MMEKIYEVICWIAVAAFALFVVLWALTRGLGSIVAMGWMFISSPLPWWVRVSAAIAVTCGFVYLFRNGRKHGIPSNHKFVERPGENGTKS